MKILILTINDSLGGAELYLKNIADYYKEEDIEVAILTNKQTNNWKDLEPYVKFKSFSSKNKFIGIVKFFFYLLINKMEFDYIFTSHIHTNGIIGVSKSLGLIRSKYVVCRESTSIFLRYSGIRLWSYTMIYYLGYRKIDLIICQTQLMKDQLLKNFNRLERKSKVVVIPNPLNINTLNKQALEEPKYKFDYIVSAGRLISVKGFDILIEAFSKLKQVNKDLKLVILGQGTLLSDLKNLASNFKIEDDVIFEGHVPNVLPYFKNAKACVVSSRLEGFPNVLLQMMSQNNIVVSTKCAGGIDEIQGVISCETNSVDSLYRGMLNGLNMRESESNRLLFDYYLKERNIDRFIEKVNIELDF